MDKTIAQRKREKHAAHDLKAWHKAVCERDGYVCQRCHTDFSHEMYFNENGVNQYVCGHHTMTRGSHPERRLDVSIGSCLCLPCHTLTHAGK